MSNKIIDKAITENKTIEFNYTKYSGETSRRRVSYINYSNEYGEFGYHKDHIEGYCHLRKEDRTFKISRMSDIKLLLSTETVYRNPQPTYKPLQSSNQTATKQIHSTTTKSSSNEGCYIATMVYGDYNHPNVLILREFRDNKLSKTLIGKAFIFLYYRFSPKLVRKLEGSKRANRAIKRVLDKIIKSLNK